MTTPTLGKAGSASVPIDVQRLLDTRLLLTASSGWGKSWAMRRLLEQTHGQVMQLVIDPEGEFATLRERCDLVTTGRGSGRQIAAAAEAGSVLVGHSELHLDVARACDILGFPKGAEGRASGDAGW